MEGIEVSVRSNAQGNIIPLSFVWKRRVYRIEAIGREWQTAEGDHVLVMTPGNRAFHLLYKTKQGRWFLLRGGDTPTIPRV
jgi:hypothetical protein